MVVLGSIVSLAVGSYVIGAFCLAIGVFLALDARRLRRRFRNPDA